MGALRTVTGVGVLDKGMALIDAVERHPMTASDLAREVDMTLSTAHRLAMALVAHGLLRRDAEGQFHLGRRFATSSLVDVAEPVLAWLAAETGETVQLWVRRADVRILVASVESEMELRIGLRRGSQLPLSDGGSAVGALTGAVPPPGTEHGHPGWVESVGKRTPGIGSVSAPVWHHGEVVAAVCVGAPIPRIQPGPGAVHGLRVLEAARRIEVGLAG